MLPAASAQRDELSCPISAEILPIRRPQGRNPPSIPYLIPNQAVPRQEKSMNEMINESAVSDRGRYKGLLPFLAGNESLRLAQEGLCWFVLAQISQMLESSFRFLLPAELMERHRSERRRSAFYIA